MCGFLGPCLSAVFNERHCDAQARKKFCDRCHFGAPFIRQATIGIFLGRFRLSVLNEVSTHDFLLLRIVGGGIPGTHPEFLYIRIRGASLEFPAYLLPELPLRRSSTRASHLPARSCCKTDR